MKRADKLLKIWIDHPQLALKHYDYAYELVQKDEVSAEVWSDFCLAILEYIIERPLKGVQ